MSEKKNIDKLFQEKFKDFEVNPPEFTWPELKVKLEKKKKKRVIPFWWQLSGVAAAFLIGFFVVRNFQSEKTEVPNGVVVGQPNNASQNPAVLNPKQKDSERIAESDQDSVTKVNQLKISTPENNKNTIADSEKKSENAEAKKGKLSNSISIRNRKNAVADASENLNPDAGKSEKTNEKPKNPLLLNQKKSRNAIGKSNSYENQNAAVAHSDIDKSEKSASEKRNGKSNLKNIQTAVAASEANQNLKSKSGKGKTNSNLKNPQNAIAESGANPDRKSNSQKSKGNSNQNSEITLVRNEITRNLNTNQALANENTAGSKSSETNAFSDLPTDSKQNAVAATEETAIKKTDSTAVAVVPNALEELLKEKEKKLVTQPEPKLNRWQISSNVAPVYLGSSSQGSPIDSSFAGNSKNYGTNLSYGLGVNYAVTKKLKIRTGINKVSWSYRTNDIFINAGLEAKMLPNVTVRNENQYLNLSNSASKTNKADFTTDTFESYLNQKMGYIEVPVELSYAVLDKKFGIDIIGGLSTLFLNENEIQIVSSGFTTNFGEANNLNKTHFSTNIGLGLRYRFFKAFEANFNPMFKYQMDTFSKDNGNFKPYYFGLYTGLSFKF